MSVAITAGSRWICNENGKVYTVLPFISEKDGKVIYDSSVVTAFHINLNHPTAVDSFSWLSCHSEFLNAFKPFDGGGK